MNAVIKAENLGKKYIISHQRQRYGDSLRDTMTHTARGIWQRIRHPLSPNRESLDLEELWALKNVDFEVQQGERIGIIGRNGAGKSTLLKILSRITEPTTGKVRIKGRVSSLLEVGTGFHLELTGRENVFLNGAILGMTRQEIKQRFDKIIAFAELEKFLDTPVKRYSSGMYVRLAFAVAAHLEPEILIVDEVLAVGDAAFQKKCLGKMRDVAGEGRTVLFVSHNMAAVQNLCSRAILLDRGCVVLQDDCESVIAEYTERMQSRVSEQIDQRTDRSSDGSVRLVDVWMENGSGKHVTNLNCGDKVCFGLSYKANGASRPLRFLIGVYNDRDQRVLAFDSKLDKTFAGQGLPAAGVARCKLSGPFPLYPGQYSMNVAVLDGSAIIDRVVNALYFTITEGDFFGTGSLFQGQQTPMFLVAHDWEQE